jgi:uncharacterized protein
VRFWDSSAVMPLVVVQAASGRVDGWAEADPALVVWAFTSVEIGSALNRLHREGALAIAQRDAAEEAADTLLRAAHTIVDVEAVKLRARRALRVHPLRAADALQLGAALEWAEGRPEGHVLHTLDDRLAAAARNEGFIVGR